MASQKTAPLCECVRHAVADHQPPAWGDPSVQGQAVGRMHTPEHEGDVGPNGAMKERDVFDGFAKRASTGMYLPSIAEERHRPQVCLAVNPLCPSPTVGF